VIHKTFIVSQLKEDAILEMPFLEKHQRHMDFQTSAVVMAGKELVCVDKFGRPLVHGAHVVQNYKIPGNSLLQSQLQGDRRSGSCGGNAWRNLIGKQPELARLSERTPHAFINSFTEPVKLSIGALVGKSHSIQKTDVGLALETVAGTQGTPRLLEPVEELFQSTWLTCIVERVATVRVVLNAKHWLNYS